MAEEEQAWYYMADGEQIGPIAKPDDIRFADGKITSSIVLRRDTVTQGVGFSNGK